MSTNPVNYTQLLETNNLIQCHGDENYWLCVTRTVQESKLFPVPAYMMLSYLNCWYRYPALFRKMESVMPAEEIADRARNIGTKCQSLMAYMPDFYLFGREWLLNMGLLKPTDGIEDIIYVLDFWKRFQLAYHRNDGHITNREFGHRSQPLPERTLQKFHADMYDCAVGDELHEAAHAFMAAASQYAFLVACESRISLNNQGPYKLDDNTEMLVRDFIDLAEGDLPWLDNVAAGVEYNNITVTIAAKDCHFYIVDDWGSFEAEPEFSADKLVGVGLYHSDSISNGRQPLGMGSREELVSTFHRLTQQVTEATNKLWLEVARFKRDQMLDAGAMVYFSVCKDIAHIAGVYDPDDWMKIDERAERFRPLLNDEYSRDILFALCTASNPTQQVSEYVMMQHADRGARFFTPIPYSVLAGEAYTAGVGEIYPGTTHLPEKKDAYTTSQGKLTIAEYNHASRTLVPNDVMPEYRFLGETWLKYHHDTPEAQRLYTASQQNSRRLQNKGAGLTRADILALRSDHHE